MIQPQASRPLVLASASPARRQLLAASGLRFDAVSSGVDETPIKRQARALGQPAEEAALRVAFAKAHAVDRPGTCVIGCDQILVCGDQWLDKPPNLAAARAQLAALRGRAHVLATATIVLCDGVQAWRHATSPRLVMRQFTDAFLDAYLALEGEALLGSVGAYRLEGPGIHLFDSIEGEHSAILGLPMLPLLRFLRSQDIIGV